MTAIYGHRWLSSYGPTDTDDTWAAGLTNLSPSQIGEGVTACINSGEEWPPSLPKFRALCLGLPTLQQVTRNILSGDKTADEFTLHVWHNLDRHRFQQSSAIAAEKLVKDAYEVVRDKIAAQPELIATLQTKLLEYT
jgi:hypothetical protein